MKMKNIKKVIAMFSMIAVSVSMMGIGTSPAVANSSVGTGVTPDLSGGSVTDPIRIKAKWEMLDLVLGAPGVGEAGKDDQATAGAQFAAPNQWGINMNYSVCAIVHGPEKNIGNIKSVITEIYYPDTPMHTSGHEVCSLSAGGIKNSNGAEIDSPSGGCGVKIEQNFLTKLDQTVGKNLVCETIRKGGNENLILWDSNEDYDKVCNDTDGQLTKGFAAVYCADKSLTWEHPAGNYKVDVFAFDKSDNRSAVFTNLFKYIETMGFEVDFSKVTYGSVKIGEHRQVFGDKCYGTSDPNWTVRNVGNVRLNMKVAQDDMGLGYQTGSSAWNVEYDARVGDLSTNWKVYSPFGFKGTTPISGQYIPLTGEILDLSEIEEMDFSIRVIEKWPGNLTNYAGTMWLGADMAVFDVCVKR